MTEVKEYACKNCGHAFMAIPPDDVHTIAISEPCNKGDSIEIPYDCQNCNSRTIIHWDKKHELYDNDFSRINVASD